MFFLKSELVIGSGSGIKKLGFSPGFPSFWVFITKIHVGWGFEYYFSGLGRVAERLGFFSGFR